MSNEPMSLEDAMRVADQLSPLPQVAHRALATLAKESKRWRFYVAAMISEDGTARHAIQRQSFPAATQEAWDASIDAAMADFESTKPGAT